MFGKYTKLMSLFTLVVLLTTAKLSAKDANGATLYMYGATIEAVAQDDSDGGILSNSQIKIINLGPIINDPGVDYAPTISADGKTLFFVSDKPGSIKNEEDDMFS